MSDSARLDELVKLSTEVDRLTAAFEADHGKNMGLAQQLSYAEESLGHAMVDCRAYILATAERLRASEVEVARLRQELVESERLASEADLVNQRTRADNERLRREAADITNRHNTLHHDYWARVNDYGASRSELSDAVSQVIRYLMAARKCGQEADRPVMLSELVEALRGARGGKPTSLDDFSARLIAELELERKGSK